jgi:hypothetical protein
MIHALEVLVCRYWCMQVLVGRAMLSTQLTHSLTGMVTLQACLLVVSESSAHPFARELAVNLLGRMVGGRGKVKQMSLLMRIIPLAVSAHRMWWMQCI